MRGSVQSRNIVDKMDDSTIDSEIQRELDAISLSSLDLQEDEDRDERSQQESEDEPVETADFPSALLFLEKSSDRNKVAEDIIREAENILRQCNTARNAPRSRDDELSESALNEAESAEYIYSAATTLLEQDSKELVSTKSVEEIEEENRIKLEELEEQFRVDEEKENLQMEQARIADEEELKHWMDTEEKTQKNVKVMMDKADYWEKTYHQVARDELIQKETELEKEFLESQQRILEMQKEQEGILQDLLNEKEHLDRRRRKDAAIRIQKIYRGYVARREYGAEVQTRISEMKERKQQERIMEIDRKRAEEKTKKETEERKRREKLKKKKERKKTAQIPESQKQNDDETAGRDGKEDDVQVDSDKQDSYEKLEESSARMKESEETVACNDSLPITNSLTTGNKTESRISFDEKAEPSPSCSKNFSVQVKDDSFDSSKSMNGGTVGQKNLEMVISHEEAEDDELVGTVSKDTDITIAKKPEESLKEKSVDKNQQQHQHGVCTSTVTKSPSETSTDENPIPATLNDESEMVEEKKSDTQHQIAFSESSPTLIFPTEILKLQEKRHCDSQDVNTVFNTPVTARNPKMPEKMGQNTSFHDPTSSKNCEMQEKVDEFQNQSNSNPKIQHEKQKDPTTKDVLILTTQLDNTEQNPEREPDQIFGTHPEEDTMSTGIGGDKNTENEDQENDHESAHPVHSDVVPQPSSLNDLEQNVKPDNFQADSMSHTSNISEEKLQTIAATAHNDKETSTLPTSKTDSSPTCISTDPKTDIEPPMADSEHQTREFEHQDREQLELKELRNREVRNNGSPDQCNPEPSNSFSCDASGSELPIENENLNLELRSDEQSHCDTSVPGTVPQSIYHEQKTKNNVDRTPNAYVEKLKQQRQFWLKNFVSKSARKTMNTHKTSPSANKRRRLIRISSAAKRLEPFSESEILNGVYITPDCRAVRKASSLDECKCLVLSDLQGGRNLIGITSCTFLTHLTVQNCGLVALENVQSCPCLKFISVPHNSINMVSCCGMKQLEFLDLSHNCLTSIHGLDGCESLIFVGLSHNNVTKITGLEDATNLSHLRIDNNQLISVSGLRFCENIIYLDVSENHLMTLEELADCNLLLVVTAAGNNIESLGERFLSNSVLLVKLDISRNNLANLGFSPKMWLPMLTELHANINRISMEAEVTDFSLSSPFLSCLSLSKNLISNVDGLECLTACKCLYKVNLMDNPLSPGSDESFIRFMPEIVMQKESKLLENASFNEFSTKFCPLDNFGKKFANLINDDCDITTKLSKQLDDLKTEVKRHSLEIQRAAVRWNGKDGICPPQMFSVHTLHLKRMQASAARSRNAHENESLMYTTKINQSEANSTNQVYSETALCGTSTMNKKEHPAALEKAQSSFLNEENMPRDLESAILLLPKPPPYQAFEDKATTESTMSSATTKIKGKPPAKILPTKTNSSIVYEKLNLQREVGVIEKVAAKKIQALWRGYHVRKRHCRIKNLRISAATKIQALWRGYRTRKKIMKAMEMLKRSEMDTLRQEEFEDVDLDGFDFDEESFDEQWAYKVTEFDETTFDLRRTLPTASPVFADRNSNMNLDVRRPPNPGAMSLSYSKPPLPPIPSRASTPLDTHLALSDVASQDISVADSNRTKKSVKQEILSNEWGIKSSSVSDLMMKRARRMKGGRKKIQTADQKLHKFQEKFSTFQNSEPLMTKRQHPVNKVEYFKAREQKFGQKERIQKEEDEQKLKYTYEWLHSQVGSNYDPNHRVSAPPHKPQQPHPPETRRTRSSGFLPAIPRSPSLVGTQDLEVVSVATSSTYMDRSKERLRDIAKRHNPSFKGHLG